MITELREGQRGCAENGLPISADAQAYPGRWAIHMLPRGHRSRALVPGFLTSTQESEMLQQYGPLGAAMMRAGIRPEDIEFDRAIAVYLNNGGTIERACARLELAAERLREGRAENAETGRVSFADAQPDLPQGQTGRADGHSYAAERESDIASGEALPDSPNEAAPAMPLTREPNAAEVAAMTTARRTSARAVFDRVLTNTGRAWGNVTYRELVEFRRDGDFADVLREYLGRLQGDDAHKRVRDLMTPLTFYRLAAKAGMIVHER